MHNSTPRTDTETRTYSRSELILESNDLNAKERVVAAILASDMNPAPLNALALLCFPNEPSRRANSWVRNSLRKLVRSQWVERVARGTYRVTDAGRAALL